MRKPLLTKPPVGSALAAAVGQLGPGQVNIICSVQAEWCNLMSTVYAKTTGTKVNMTAKGLGRALAQLNAERPTPRPTSGLAARATRTCRRPNRASRWNTKSPQLAQLHPGQKSRR